MSRFLKDWLQSHPDPTVLFDLDGTLVDSVPDLTAAIDDMLITLDRAPAGEAQVSEWVGLGARVLVQRALAGGPDQAAIARLSPAEVAEAEALFGEAYARRNGEQTRVMPGVWGLLDALRDRRCRLGVVTNKPERFIGPLLARTELASYFAVWVGGDTLPQRKPDPQPLAHAIAQLGGRREASLFIGDSTVDVETAHALGIPCLCYSGGYNQGQAIEDAGADAVVDSYEGLL
ncbi:phosphoglycolate phosphatase [Marinobacteraceae bacterium S3BR75-40.1]